MTSKYISIKVYGNPNSNSGFIPLLLYNNPSFVVEDQFYVGFDKCSFFFSIRVEQNQTVYKLIKNNVRSFGAVRAGSLVIAFSLPKGYEIDNGYTPYDVLIQLKDEFLKKCMTLKDPTRETYEFRPEIIDQHILDEVAKQFSISPAEVAHRVMNPTGPIGYLVLPEEKIENLFKDSRYPEYQDYKEVVIAETVNNSSYIPVPNIQIPRPKIYTIIFNGGRNGKRIRDVEENITVSSSDINNPNNQYYEHRTVDFTIKSLLEGDKIDGITLNKAKEEVIIDTTGWAIPITKTYTIRINPDRYEKHILTTYRPQVLSPQNNQISLNNNFKFNLSGEEIAWVEKKSLRISIPQNQKYESDNSYIVKGNDLIITVKEKQQTHRSQTTNNQVPAEIKTSPVVDFKFVLSPEFFSNKNGKQVLKIEAKDKSEDNLSCTMVYFDHNQEGHLYIPRLNIKDVSKLCFSNKKYKYCYEIPRVNKNEYEIVGEDLKKEKISITSRHKKKIIISFMIAFLLISGCLTGYYMHDPVKRLFTTEETKSSTDENNSDVTNSLTNTKDRENAIALLSDADAKLKSDNQDLTFDDIKTLYNRSTGINLDTLKNVDSSMFDNKIHSRIIDYYSMIVAIENQNKEEIISLMKNGNLHIYKIHKDNINIIINNDANFEKFTQNSPNIRSFKDLAKCNVEQPKHICQPGACDMSFASIDDLNRHKNERGHWYCKECHREHGNWDSRQPTKIELENHITNFHKNKRSSHTVR